MLVMRSSAAVQQVGRGLQPSTPNLGVAVHAKCALVTHSTAAGGTCQPI